MKLKYLLLLFSLQVFIAAIGQKKGYITLSTENRYPFASANLYREGTNFDNNSYSLNSLTPVGSYGYGIYYTLGAGIQLNKSIQTGINFSYKTTDLAAASMDYKSDELTSHADFNSTLMLVNPHVRFIKTPNSGLGKLMSFYFTAGVVAGRAGATIAENITKNSGVSSTIYDYKKHTVLGFNSGLGILFTATERWQFFIETNVAGLNCKPKTLKVTTTENGITKSYETDLSGKASSVHLKTTLPFSSVGVAFGVKFNFIKTKGAN